MSSLKESPNKYPLPPILTVGMLILCYLLDTFLPLGWEPEQVTGFMRSAGLLLIVVALALDVWAFLTFRKHKANMMPHKPATHLLTSGPFAHSRNPIYLADILILLGVSLWTGSIVGFLSVPVFFLILERRFIRPEENRLEEAFGEDFRRYKSETRRWL